MYHQALFRQCLRLILPNLDIPPILLAKTFLRNPPQLAPSQSATLTARRLGVALHTAARARSSTVIPRLLRPMKHHGIASHRVRVSLSLRRGSPIRLSTGNRRHHYLLSSHCHHRLLSLLGSVRLQTLRYYAACHSSHQLRRPRLQKTRLPLSVTSRSSPHYRSRRNRRVRALRYMSSV